MIVLNFHRIERATGLEITRLSPRRFVQILDEVASSGIQDITLTFDDGYASIADNALPVLNNRGMSAIVFLITDAIGRDDSWDVRILGRGRPMMTWTQVREWSGAGFIFGSHTRSHRDLTALTPRRLREELVDSKDEIQNRIGSHVSFLSYPFGRHNKRVREAARLAGYEAAYAIAGIPGNPYAIPRVNAHGLMSLSELRHILRGSAPSWRTRMFASLSAGSATVGNWRSGFHAIDTSVDPRRLAWGNSTGPHAPRIHEAPPDGDN